MENSDVSSNVSVSLQELSIEVYKYLYINRKVFLMIRNPRLFMARYKYATTDRTSDLYSHVNINIIFIV